MKIKDYAASLQEKMSEFDMWVTPSLGEIRDTPQFKMNLNQLKTGFDQTAEITDNFSSIALCAASSLAEHAIQYISELSESETRSFLDNVCNVLLLATGKTDNNLKCQFPLMLKDQIGILKFPQRTAKGCWKEKDIPRTLSMEDVTKILSQLKEQKDFLSIFLQSYFHLIVSDEEYAKQLWSLGSAYVAQRELGSATALISSIVIFQSRGSITATQGHIPELILREYMTEWGLTAGTDFNTQDVEIGDILGDVPADNKIKKRKYDFIIPFQSRTDGAKVFIQSQYYAGDSGSVSHKVVDQTDSTREVTLRKFPKAVFIEYLDGAGYFSSLNGDLRKMLAKSTTKDFIQIRSAPIKLRRELQGIQFLTPLEIEHAIMRTSGSQEKVVSLLQDEGYTSEEIKMATISSIRNGHIILAEDGTYSLKPDRIDIVRRYCILDVVANYGSPVAVEKQAGVLFVPGFEVCWGLPQNQTIKIALEVFPTLKDLWANPQVAFDDIQWLITSGFIITK